MDVIHNSRLIIHDKLYAGVQEQEDYLCVKPRSFADEVHLVGASLISYELTS